METRNDESRLEPKPGPEERKRRFQIVKLEERIAPHRGRGHDRCYFGNYHYNPHGKPVGNC